MENIGERTAEKGEGSEGVQRRDNKGRWGGRTEGGGVPSPSPLFPPFSSEGAG